MRRFLTHSTIGFLFLSLSAWPGGCSRVSDDDGADDDGADDDDLADDDAGDDDLATDPISDPDGLVGGRYLLDFATGEPEEAMFLKLMSQYLTEWWLVLQVEALHDGAGTIALRYNGAAPAVAGSWDNPQFAVGPGDVLDTVSGDPLAWGVTVDGAFVDDGAAMDGVTVAGTYDSRPLDALVDPAADEGAGCELLASWGVECQGCPGGLGPFCFELVVTSMRAERLPTP